MHILAFYQYFSTNEVSGSTRPYEIFRRLMQSGDSVTIIAANWVYATGKREARQGLFWSHTQVEGLNVIRVTIPFGGSRKIVPRIIGFLWFIPFAFFAALSARKADVIIASSTPLTIGIPAYLLSRSHRVPFIFELRDLWPDCPVVWGVVKNRLLIRASYWLESFLYRKAAFLVSVTEGIRKELIKKGIPAEGVRTITTACDLNLFTPDGPQEDLERLANIPADAFLCIHTGSLGLANSLDFILDGAERLLEDGSIHFLFVGNGPEKPRLMSEVSRRNLRNVHFLSPVPKAALPRFLRRADLGILCVKPSPLTYIFLQNKFFDYLACGCPVIVNFEGEAREYVEPVNAGVFVPPGDVEALSSAIRKLAANRDSARNMRAHARQLAERNFSWDYKAAEYREIISSVLTKNAVGHLAPAE
jgi:glycosyltransferase involved in cell wall biosynthesis